VQDGRVLGIDQASLQRALAQQVDEAAGDIAALQPLLKRFQEGLTRFYQASDHSSRS
jgi:endonuclease/exonuclease/phosphatase family metal-dependent hydrolase